MSKDTKNISDLRSFFAKNDDNRAIKCIMGVMEHINIRSSQIGVEKKGKRLRVYTLHNSKKVVTAD